MSKILNIGIVANSAFNIYNFRLGLIKALQREAHQVFAIAPSDEYVQLLKENGIEFIAVKHLARKGTNPFLDLRLINEFRRIYSEKKLDVALQYTIKPNIYGTLAARFSGTKTICTVTGLGYTFLNKSLSAHIAHNLYRLAFSSAHKIIFQNKEDQKIFIDNKLAEPQKTMIVPGSGVDTAHFHPGFCADLKKDDTVRFLMIGRLLKDKGVYEYAAAARNILQQNKNVEFLLLGDIDNDNPSAIRKEELQSWITDKIITYYAHTWDTRPLICLADCVVLPSYREGMPRVILEGMAMGKPCITTDAPGCRDAVIEGESGFLCQSKDTNSLQQALENFISLSNEYKIQIGISARERVENVFSNENIFKNYLGILRNLD